MGRYPSGQRGQTVNLLPSASKVRILACPPNAAWGLAASEGFEYAKGGMQGGRSSGVELQPSKLAVASSNLVARSKSSLRRPRRAYWTGTSIQGAGHSIPQVGLLMTFGAHVAQLAEHVLGKDEVTRSIRVVGSIQGLRGIN